MMLSRHWTSYSYYSCCSLDFCTFRVYLEHHQNSWSHWPLSLLVGVIGVSCLADTQHQTPFSLFRLFPFTSDNCIFLLSHYYFGLLHLSRESFKIIILILRDRGKVCIYFILSKPYFKEFHWVCCYFRQLYWDLSHFCICILEVLILMALGFGCSTSLFRTLLIYDI